MRCERALHLALKAHESARVARAWRLVVEFDLRLTEPVYLQSVMERPFALIEEKSLERCCERLEQKHVRELRHVLLQRGMPRATKPLKYHCSHAAIVAVAVEAVDES